MNPRMNILHGLVEHLPHITALLVFLLAASCEVRVAPRTEPQAPADEAGRLPEARVTHKTDLPAPAGIFALPRADRVDLYWQEPEGWRDREDWAFEIEVDEGGGFQRAAVSDVPGFAYFFRENPPARARVRSIAPSSGTPRQTSEWSEIVIPPPKNGTRDLIAEIQEASFRYFWNYRHPVSFLPREGVGGWNRNMCSIAASGMMFFNIATGIENGWITPEEGRSHVLTALRFLAEKAERFHGVLPHWVHGETGKVIPFSEKDDGADLVEHAFVVAGALFAREYFKEDPSFEAIEIRRLAQRLWEETEWTWFVKRRPDGRAPLVWHWSPRHGFAIDLEIAGFNESAIVYLLALASPTHPISLNSYTNGWIAPGYGHRRRHYGVDLRLGREPLGPPLFFAHYSYLGVDPRALYFDGKSYFQHFADFCRVQEAWAAEHLREYPRGIWGLTAGMGPDGYGVFYPGKSDGTITPTAALASMPYAPQSVLQFAEVFYKHYARSLWGPYGFRDGVNARRNWFSPHYIAINVGPIAPMIENHRTGLGWRTLMSAPEIQRAIAMVNGAMSPAETPAVHPPPSAEPAMKIPARISASSEQDGLLAAYAMDGDPATRWSSDFADDQWWQADFDEPVPIAGLAIRWEQAFAERYRVEITEDGHSWRTVYEVSSSDGGRDLLFFEPARAKGLRIVCEKRGTGWGNSIWEIDLIPPDRAPKAAATSERPGGEAARAIDGRTTTAWRPVGTAGEEITLTWAGPLEIGGVELLWGSAPPDYDILLTRDGHTWSVVSSRRGARAPLQTDYFSAAPAIGLTVRIAAPSKTAPAEEPALARIEFKAPEERATPIRQYQSLARDYRPGFFPRWLNREQEFWTTAGLPGEPVELLITESGVVEPRKGAFSVQPYLWHGERLITGADVELEQRLEDGFLPIPQVRWLMPGVALDISAVLFGEPGNRWAAVRYRADLREGDRARLGLAVRPVSVVPAWQHAGFSPIRHLSVTARHGGFHGIDIHGTPAMFFSRAPESIGATAGVEREAAFYAERGIAPPAGAAMNRDGLTSALAWFDLGENSDVVALFPIDADGRAPDGGWLQPGSERVDALFEQARREWRARLGRPEIDIPERRLIEVMKSNLGYILINRDAPWFKPGPRNYNHAWMRDGSLTAAAVLRCGFTNEVREFITAFAAHVRDDGWVPWMILESGAPVGFSENLDAGEGHEYDSQGQFAFIVREYLDFTGDERLVRALYPKVISAMRFADKLRSLRLTGEYLQHPEKRAYRGILPASNSHEGYYPARHSYWDGYWLIRGLKDALALAERFGERDDAEWLRRFLEEYRDAHNDSMRTVMEGAGLDTLPGCVELADFDPTSTSIALIYADELPFMPTRETLNTFDRFWRELSARIDAGAKRQYTPYEVRNADAFLRLGWRERALQALRFYLRDAVRPPGWNHMAEVVHSPPRAPAYIGDMPHTWVGADYLRAVLALFAFEEGDRLVIGAGIDPAWLAEGIRVHDLRTRFGAISYTLRLDGSGLIVDMKGTARPAGGIELRLPDLPHVSFVQINGRRVPPSDRIVLDAVPEGEDRIRAPEHIVP